MTYRKKKELEALRKSVELDPLNDVVRASYLEINPKLEFKNNKWRLTMQSFKISLTEIVSKQCLQKRLKSGKPMEVK